MMWTEWRGGREIDLDTNVIVRFRNGQESKTILPASAWRWKHGGPFADRYEWDIVAYRKVDA